MTKRGVVSVTKGPVDLVQPPHSPAGQVLRYGVVTPFQIGPRQAALYCNIRHLGVTPIDFEAGADVIPFDDPAAIDAARAVTVTRSHARKHPKTGRDLIMVKQVEIGGFVPFGAKRPDGSEHPHAGSGFAMGTATGFAADYSQRLAGDAEESFRYLELRQLSYDGKSFRVGEAEIMDFDELLPGWRVGCHGLGAGIPDGDDLLCGLAVRGREAGLAGLARWRRGSRGWRPVSFAPVTGEDTSIEPNIHRDVDGALLFAARCISHEKGDAVSRGIRAWRSTDGGASWRQVVSAPRTRGSTPVVLNQAADGTPYVCANPYWEAVHDDSGRKVGVWSHRQKIHLWPLDDDRTGLLEPILVRDTADFGPPPAGRLWFADHPIANTVRLADGQWRNLLCYRVRISQPTGKDAEFPTPATGNCVEEVTSSGDAIPRWAF